MENLKNVQHIHMNTLHATFSHYKSAFAQIFDKQHFLLAVLTFAFAACCVPYSKCMGRPAICMTNIVLNNLNLLFLHMHFQQCEQQCSSARL